MAKKKEITTIQDLTLDDLNFNKHTAEGMKLLEKSISENKFGRSVLADKDGKLIAGNGVVETAQKLGKTKIKVVQTEGDELVVVQRMDLDIDSKEARELAILDNSSAYNNLVWDSKNLKEVADKLGFSHEDLKALGIAGRALSHIHGEITEPATDFAVDKYIYEPHGDCPDLKDCINTEKYDAIVARIEAAEGLTTEQKKVLKLCAYRFVEIDMSQMAEYYCHATKAMQAAMEDNCLVIIDAKQALEKGLIRLSKDLEEVLKLEIDA